MTQTPVAHVGDELHDGSGQKIGKITDVISDDRTLEPEWFVVKVGMLKGSHPVPVRSVRGSGSGAAVAFGKDLVMSAPKLQEGTPTQAEQEALYVHYGMSD